MIRLLVVTVAAMPLVTLPVDSAQAKALEELIYGDRPWHRTNPAIHWNRTSRTIALALFTDVRCNLDG
jgi:hypothetical protein